MKPTLDHKTINQIVKPLRFYVKYSSSPTEYSKGYRAGYNAALTDLRFELNDFLKRNKETV